MARPKFDREKIVTLVSKSARKGPRTKSQLANHFNLSYGFVTNVVNELVNEGRLFEAGKRNTGQRGRPETLYRSE